MSTLPGYWAKCPRNVRPLGPHSTEKKRERATFIYQFPLDSRQLQICLQARSLTAGTICERMLNSS